MTAAISWEGQRGHSPSSAGRGHGQGSEAAPRAAGARLAQLWNCLLAAKLWECSGVSLAGLVSSIPASGTS